MIAVAFAAISGFRACWLIAQTFINYYPDVPPKSEGEVAKTWEQLRQLYGTNEGSGAPSAYGAQGM